MKKFNLIAGAMLFASTLLAGTFAEDFQKAEKWINKKYPENSADRKMQTSRLYRIKNSNLSESQKSDILHKQYFMAFVQVWELEMEAAKNQKVTFSADNKPC